MEKSIGHPTAKVTVELNFKAKGLEAAQIEQVRGLAADFQAQMKELVGTFGQIVGEKKTVRSVTKP